MTSDLPPLPSSRELLSSLILHLSSHFNPTLASEALSSASTSPAVPSGGALLTALPPEARDVLLTLHCLLPTKLLPALDLLDRGLVTRCILEEPQPQLSLSAFPFDPTGTAAGSVTQAPTILRTVYYVQSANPLPSRSRSTPKYEVQTRAWNCSCASFAFAMGSSQSQWITTPTAEEAGATSDTFPVWGGCTLGDGSPPLCKHLVACALAEGCENIFGRFVVQKVVTREQLAEFAVLWN